MRQLVENIVHMCEVNVVSFNLSRMMCIYVCI